MQGKSKHFKSRKNKIICHPLISAKRMAKGRVLTRRKKLKEGALEHHEGTKHSRQNMKNMDKYNRAFFSL